MNEHQLEYEVELQSLLASTLIHHSFYPGSFAYATEETKKILTQKETRTPTPIPQTHTHTKKVQTPIPVKPAAVSPAPSHSHTEKQTQKSEKLESTEPPPLATHIANIRLCIAPRPLQWQNTMHSEDIVAKMPKIHGRQDMLQDGAELPWALSYPRALIANAAPDYFSSFAQTVTTAIQDKITPAKYVEKLDELSWIELITYASTKKLKAVICFIDKCDLNPYAVLQPMITQNQEKPIAPFRYIGEIYSTSLYTIEIDHDFLESKKRKAALWNSLIAMLR